MKSIAKLISFLLIIPIKGYQRIISPWLPAMCRYQPTCSKYSIEAIEKHGPVKGLLSGVKKDLILSPIRWFGLRPGPMN